jgi:hypothetical protein
VNTDWKAFVGGAPWFLEPGQVAEVGDTRGPDPWRPATSEFDRHFPRLHRLLMRARVTPVDVAGDSYELFTWLEGAESRAWLARPPTAEPPRGLYPAHRTMLRSFGGIVERNEPLHSWLLNQNEVLTEREAAHDASFIRDYAWAFESVGGIIPIELSAFYSIAREANGNDTLCDRTSGRVLLFAPDHSFTHVTPLAGCPEYTLYELDGARDFVSWVEVVAQQWLDGLGGD